METGFLGINKVEGKGGNVAVFLIINASVYRSYVLLDD